MLQCTVLIYKLCIPFSPQTSTSVSYRQQNTLPFKPWNPPRVLIVFHVHFNANYAVMQLRKITFLSERVDLNHRPIAYQASALPTELRSVLFAEGAGFEPARPFKGSDGLANRWFQPLTHPSE